MKTYEQKVIIWENLSFIKSIFSIIFYYIYSYDKIYYVNNTFLSKFFLLKFRIFSKLKLENIDRVDKSGFALKYKSEEITWRIVKKFFNSNKIKQSANLQEIQNECWLRILKSWYVMKIQKKTDLYLIFNNYILNNKYNKAKIFFENFPLFNEWLDEINFSESLEIHKWFVFKNSLFPVLNILRILLFTNIFFFINKKFKSKIKSKKKFNIFEEYVKNIFSRYPTAGHLFWFPHSNISPDRVILYFDRRDTDCKKEHTDEIDKYNFSWLELKKRTQFPLTFGLLLRSLLKVKLPRTINKDIWDLYSIQIYYLVVVEWYKNILIKFNVKIVHQHQEFWPETLSLALATRLTGGLFIWNHWSLDRYLVSYFNCGFADIVFSWGDLNDSYFNCHNFKYEYMLQTGLISADDITAEDKKIAVNILSKFSNDVNFTLTILDSSHESDSIHQSTGEMIFFYNKLLDLALSKNNWGIIIKSKGISLDKIIMINEINDKLQKLIDQNRCFILKNESRVIPSCIASNISVCFDINSAGVLGALADQKSVYWDISKNIHHPFYSLQGNEKIVFQSFMELETYLNKFEKGECDIGSHHKFINLIDPFKDGLGAKRAGLFINDFLKYLENNNDRKTALIKSIQNYSLKWGESKVTKYGVAKKNDGNVSWINTRNIIAKALLKN